MTILVQLFFFLLSAGWAVFSWTAFVLLANSFPSSGPFQYGISDFLASLQAYLLVFGPVVVAIIFLIVRWPNRLKEKILQTTNVQ